MLWRLKCVPGTDFVVDIFIVMQFEPDPHGHLKGVFDVMVSIEHHKFEALCPPAGNYHRMISPWRCVLAPPSKMVGSLSAYYGKENRRDIFMYIALGIL